MSQRSLKGDLLPRVAVDASSNRQSPNKGAALAALRPAQPSPIYLAATSFISGAILMLVISLGSGTVQWQGGASREWVCWGCRQALAAGWRQRRVGGK